MNRAAKTLALSAACAALLSLALGGQAQEFGRTAATPIPGRAAGPERVCFSDTLPALLKKPDGFHVGVFAKGLGDPQTPVVAADGTVYVACPAQGTVVALRDCDGDGQAKTTTTVLTGLKGLRGIALHEGTLYLVTDRALYAAGCKADGTLAALQSLSDDLPAGAADACRDLAFGPSGNLYVTVGGATGRSGTILAVETGSGQWRRYARGVRDALGFDWQPDTGQMWGVGSADGGSGNARLGRLAEDGAQSRLFCYTDCKDTGGGRAADSGLVAETASPDLPAYSAPVGIAFYTGTQFPIDYRGDAFVALHGADGHKSAGFKVVRVRFRAGKPVRTEDFLTGFLMPGGTRQFGRPSGVAIARDGALLVADDANGVLYRVSYRADDVKQTALFGRELH